MTVGIHAMGAFIPMNRLSRSAVVEANSWFNPALRRWSRGERAICNWDEDPVTMAVEAARDALDTRDDKRCSGVYLASTSTPFAQRQNAGLVVEALRLGETVSTMDVAASQRAGTSALAAALKSATGEGDRILVLASEKRCPPAASTAELLAGDGAAALLVGPGEGAARLVGTQFLSVDFVDSYRARDRDFDYQWEERWIRDEGYLKLVPRTVSALLKTCGVAAADITHFCLPATLPRVGERIAAELGLPRTSVRDGLDGVCGDTGAAHAVLMLVHALETAKPGDHVLVVGMGQGCDALLFQVTDQIEAMRAGIRGVSGSLARRRPMETYTRYLAINDLIRMDHGLRAEVDKQTPLTVLYRNREMLLGLIGGRCNACDTVQFPKSSVCANPECGAWHSQADHSFARSRANVVSWSADSLTYCPDPPAFYGMVQFEEGGRLMIDFTDIDADTIEVGSPMRMVFRVRERDNQRGFIRYFWKASPASI